ncbi:Zinc finger RNA-binding protein [Morus notabilis]|uniref:Zinc finger RNA-binding protein n=1 Tax=Morus notabilis TaxID=981085 RepID=W9S2S0_9ROSA|nr:zinc finger RNA-binding protein [Morus notabilis]EXC11034.1 Zinc finger RNA-binding protein [Morus notabilis]
MFDPSQFTYTNLSSHFPDQLHTTNPNNPYFPVPQPFLSSSLTSEPYIHPPGTDPLPNWGSLQLTSGEFQAKPPNSEDPNSASQNWVVKQSAPIRYDALAKPENENSLLTTSSNSFWTHQPPATNVTAIVPQQTEASQTISFPNQTSSIGGQVTYGTPTMATSVELEMKKRKILGCGTALDSVRMCTICNVACNSEEVFNKHVAGRKHAAQAALAALGDIGPYFAAVRAQFNGTPKKFPKKIKFVQSAWCEVCKINCNSNDVYVSHLSGKKHQKNLEQLNKLQNNPSSTSSSTISSSSSSTPMIGPAENPEANKSKNVVDAPKSLKIPTGEDLEAKRKKIVKAGGAAGAIRTCAICNVVCNSQTVFNFHLGGQKHADMVKKLKAAGKEIAGP